MTGACGFFGRTFTRGLLDAGARVVLMSRSDAIHGHARQYARRFGRHAVARHQVDFYDRGALEAALRRVREEERVDILLNNAYDMSPRTGFNSRQGRLEAAPFDQWQRAFESGIYWAVRATQVLGEPMARRRGGSIINVASMYGLVSPNPALYEGARFLNPPTYSVMKSGLLAFTRYVAAFWGGHGVRCNALVPGPFSNTEDAAAGNAVRKDDPFLTRVAARTLLGRVGRPRELLGALLFLASDASSYMTGQMVVVDGGWTVT